jgi:hypothetical protein
MRLCHAESAASTAHVLAVCRQACEMLACERVARGQRTLTACVLQPQPCMCPSGLGVCLGVCLSASVPDRALWVVWSCGVPFSEA